MQAQASRELLLQHLREARLRSQRLRESLRAGAKDASHQLPARKSNGVDRKVYDQLRNSRNRLSKELSEKNRMIASLERQIQERDSHLMAAHAVFSRLSQNLRDLQSLTSSAAATARYGVHSRVDHAALALIHSRAQQLHEAFTAELEQLQSHVPREVPISWYGVASEVRLMGSFDNWTRGFDLSTEEITDSVFTTFRATVPMVPGTYLVKFLVDGEWRLAPEWPAETSSTGDTNNVLSVL